MVLMNLLRDAENVLQIHDLLERFHCTVLICNMAQKRIIDKSKSIIEWQDIDQTRDQTIKQIIMVFENLFISYIIKYI